MKPNYKNLIDDLPISRYRKDIKQKSKCIEHKEMLQIISKELAKISEIFFINKSVILSLLFEYKFNVEKMQDTYFEDDDRFFKSHGLLEKIDESFCDEETIFLKNYENLKIKKYKNIDFEFDEEQISNLNNESGKDSGFNRVMCIGALYLKRNNESESKNLLMCNPHLVRTVLKDELKELRGQIEIPRKIQEKCNFITSEFYFDLCLKYLKEKEIFDCLEESKIPNEFVYWFNELKKRNEKVEEERMKKLEENSEMCDICYDEVLPEEMVKNRCGHSFCKTCMISHILQGIQANGKDIYKMKCPEKTCSCKITIDFVRSLLDDFSYYKYCHLLTSAWIENNKQMNMKYCVNNKCDKILYHTQVYETNVSAICDCQTDMCLKCGKTNHKPATCEHWKQWEDLMAKDGLNWKWIRENSRKCPNPSCSAYVEKNGGCQWMRCSKCGCFYCWVCMQVTNDHVHRNGQVCRPYVHNEDKAEYVDDETLKYITHYDLQDVGVKQSFERYLKILELIYNNKAIKTTYTPLYEASLVEIDAHTILRNLYVYSCYNRKQSALIEKQVEVFGIQAQKLTERIQAVLKVEGTITVEFIRELDLLTKNVQKLFENLSDYGNDEDDFF